MNQLIRNMKKYLYISPTDEISSANKEVVEDIQAIFTAYRDIMGGGEVSVEGTPLSDIVEVPDTIFEFFHNALQISLGLIPILGRTMKFDGDNVVILCVSKEEYDKFLLRYSKTLDHQIQNFKATFTELLQQQKVTKKLLKPLTT